jgi:hypothetical protein
MGIPRSGARSGCRLRDQNINRPESRRGLIYTRVYLFLVRHIHANSDCGFLIAQFACCLRGFGRIEIGDYNAAVGFHIAPLAAPVIRATLPLSFMMLTP